MVSSGDLCRVMRGAYALGASARDLSSSERGATLLQLGGALAVLGPHAVLSHQSAARLHQIDLLNPATGVTVTGPQQRGWTARAGVQLHASTLPDDQVTSVAGLAVTTPARTVVDLARSLEFRAGVVAADSALHRALTTKAGLSQVLSTQSRWPGARLAGEVTAFADARAESPLESIARVAFRDCGLPPPDLQVWLGGIDEPIGRVDFYWREFWTIAEVDGAFKYANPERARQQLRRDSRLREDGFEVVHFTWWQITRTPEAVALSIRKAFRRGLRNATRPGRTAATH